MRLAAEKFGGLGWRAYDEQFRLLVAENPEKDWAHIDNHLWLLCMTQTAESIRRGPTNPYANDAQKQINGGFPKQGGQKKGTPTNKSPGGPSRANADSEKQPRGGGAHTLGGSVNTLITENALTNPAITPMYVGNVVETTQSPSVKNSKTRVLNVDCYQGRNDRLHVLDVAMKVDDTQLTQFHYCETSKVDTEHKSQLNGIHPQHNVFATHHVAAPASPRGSALCTHPKPGSGRPAHPAAAPATCAQHNTSRHGH